MPVNNTIIRGQKIRPIKDHVLVYEMNFGERKTKAGLILPGDDGRERGLRPRWAKVYAVGPEQKDIEPGQWVLVAHGRWTRSVKYEIDGKELVELRRADNNDILGTQWEEPEDDYVADSQTAIF